MLKKALSALAFLLFFFVSYAQKNVISVNTELERLNDIGQLPNYFDGSKVFQESSYDRTGYNNDGFEGKYSYLYKTDEGHLVVFDAKGKGVIERMWTPTPTDDTLDFYIDGSTKPTLSVKYNDLFSGKVFPFVDPLAGHKVGGFYNYFPIPFNNGCKIVFRGNRILFHQFQYRKLDDQYQVESFDPWKLDALKPAMGKLYARWNKSILSAKDLYEGVQKSEKNIVLAPGKSVVLADLQKGGRIVGIELSDAAQFETMQNLVDLRITFDNEKNAAIYAPVADFFGFAFGGKSMKSLLMGVDSSNRAYCFLPMPFDQKAKIELVYRNGNNAKPIRLRSMVSYLPVKRDAAQEGRLYVNWKRNEPALGKPYVFLEGEGKGHYVGTILQSQGKTYTEFTEFFEGDDSTVIDGVNSLHGTGSEDYFNGGWYAQPGGWVERLGTHLHGCLDYSLPYSRTGGYRFYISDKLPFNQKIHHSIEHGPEKNNRAVMYTSLAFYYAGKPVQQTMVPSNASSKVFIPDTLTFYARLMDHLSFSDGMESRDGQGFLAAGKAGITSVRVNEIEPGNYEVLVDISDDPLFEAGIANGTLRKVDQKAIHNFYRIGTTSIAANHELLKIKLKSGSSDLRLHRVMLVKK